MIVGPVFALFSVTFRASSACVTISFAWHTVYVVFRDILASVTFVVVRLISRKESSPNWPIMCRDWHETLRGRPLTGDKELNRMNCHSIVTLSSILFLLLSRTRATGRRFAFSVFTLHSKVTVLSTVVKSSLHQIQENIQQFTLRKQFRNRQAPSP